MDASVGHIRKGRKYDQVIAGARDVFLRDGYEGASVDDIARAAGVSKATLYSYFPDKQRLFMEVARLQCRDQADEAITHIDFSQSTEDLLRGAGRTFLDIVLSPMAIENFRMCVAEVDRFPALAEEFWRYGPIRFVEGMNMLLEVLIARGDIAIPEAEREMVVYRFGEMLKAGLHMHLLFNIRSSVTDAEKQANADAAARMLLACYGTRR